MARSILMALNGDWRPPNRRHSLEEKAKPWEVAKELSSTLRMERLFSFYSYFLLPLNTHSTYVQTSMRKFLNHMSHEALFLFPNVVYGYMMLRNTQYVCSKLFKDYFTKITNLTTERLRKIYVEFNRMTESTNIILEKSAFYQVTFAKKTLQLRL